ncbi:hypothetical protein IMX26_05970 [Clostridium sp. 'deep sea']|uniref:DUF6602 domain-containing protein n=1 Tax=Clostridium sp. 'deep sea' TaxID=2779445 RepID=UPI0018968FD4|nr:DUF6602 domain-containing protein [Clostridium sp. 'deep sea']QOR36358.1 hypothetical protein IMX26_05970 [Clostridium sp. 'deep sea']
MKFFDKYNDYIERLLLVQYNASEIINHKLTRGEIREEFLKDQVIKRFKALDFRKGVIIDDDKGYQSSQLDIIVTKENAPNEVFGSHSIVDIKYAEIVLEVKSCADTCDLKKLNQIANEMKKLNNSFGLKVGLFCYSYKIQKRNMLKKFGYRYDDYLDSYILDKSLPQHYPNIDFVLALDVKKIDRYSNNDFFIIKDIPSDKFILFEDEPVSKHFFNMFKNI